MAAPPPSEDHDCGWKARAIDLEDDLAKMRERLASFEKKMAAMERRFLGKKSEKIAPVAADVRKVRPKDPAEIQATRKANAELRATKAETKDEHHRVPAASKKCPKCCSTKFRAVGQGKISYVLDYVPGYFRRTRHIREVLACECAAHVVTAPGPDYSIEGTSYGDGLRAWVVTSKCADSIPVYRQSKQLSRLGIPIGRSTLNDLLHQTAKSLVPLSTRLLKLIAASDLVLADETSHRPANRPSQGGEPTLRERSSRASRGSTGRATSGATNRGTAHSAESKVQSIRSIVNRAKASNR